MRGREKGLIAVPAFNEVETIGGVVREILDEGLGCDIVVVNDGSSDDMESVLQALPVTVLSHPINLGYGAAVQTGMMYAVRHGYDFLVLMDADGQHVPSQIGVLLEELQRGKDIVMLGLRKFKVAEVPVIVRERQGGVSMYANLGTVLYYPFKSLLASFIVLLRLVRNRKGGGPHVVPSETDDLVASPGKRG